MFVPLTTHGVETGEYVSIDLELLAVNFHSFPPSQTEWMLQSCIDYVGGYEVVCAIPLCILNLRLPVGFHGVLRTLHVESIFQLLNVIE